MSQEQTPIIYLEGEYRCLSTLHPVWVKYGGQNWPSPEHALAAARFPPDLDTKGKTWKILWQTATPEQARRSGKRLPVRKDWPQVRDRVLEEVVRELLEQYPALRQKLRDTGSSLLLNVEDTEFGCQIDQVTGEIKGKNRLGNLLMRLRSELSKPVSGKQNEDHQPV